MGQSRVTSKSWQRSLVSIMVMLLAITAAPTSVLAAAESDRQSELFDKYYFNSPQEELETAGGATVTAKASSLVEVLADDKLRIAFGTFSIATRQSPINVSVESLSLAIPKASCVTIRDEKGSVAITVNETESSVSVDSGHYKYKTTTILRAGESQPKNESALDRVLT